VTLTLLAILALAMAAIPCRWVFRNLKDYRPAPWLRAASTTERLRPISVLVPARNEEHNIRATVQSILASRGVEFEAILLDDQSTDATAEIARELASADSRLRLESAPPLPVGWCGKQHACHVLSTLARHPLLVFLDADVRLTPDALERMANFIETSQADLASGIPRQEAVTFSERLLIPLVHFILLGFLPLHRMRRSNHPALAAGCGQLLIVRADAYRSAGGHAMIRNTLHDGLKLPRLLRVAGFTTDLFDATDIASCRMYRSNGEVWRGLSKNAIEGLGAPGTIGPVTLILFGGQVLPLVLLALAAKLSPTGLVLTLVAVVLAYLPRLVLAVRFDQTVGSALLHPVGVVALLAIQWYALARWLLGRPASWKGRDYGVSLSANL